MKYGYIKICMSSFYIYPLFQIDIFTLNSRKNSKQNTHLNGRKLVEDANMTLVQHVKCHCHQLPSHFKSNLLRQLIT